MKLRLKVPAKDIRVKTSNARNIKRAISKADSTQIIKFGTPLKVTETDSCINCTLYLRCADPKKGRNFRCSKYAPVMSTFTRQMAAIRENVTSENYEVFQDFDETDFDPKAKRKAAGRAVSQEDEETADLNNDFLKLVDSMIAEQELSPVPRDLKIDDRDMPQARNYFEWITSKRFLNMEMDPFAKQVETGLNLFAEWCPRCSNKDYALCIPTRDKPRHILEEIQLLEFGCCPKCKGTKEEFYRAHELNVPCELVGLGGQRGTKSTQTAMMLTYHTHAYMKLQNPSQVFKLLNNQILHGQLSALTWQGAKELLFDPIRDMMIDSPWFQGYHQILDHYGNKYGQELYKLKDIFYSNRARKLTLYPIGPDRKKMRGRTSYCAAIDEIGLMDSEDNSNKVKMNADEVYTSVRNALQTLRVFYYKSILKKGKNSVLPPIMCCISSPLSKRDKIVRLREEALKNPRRMYSFHYSTWEMNPRFTKKDLLEELNGDVGKLMRDFGAVPPNSSLPYIDDVELARPCISKRHQNLFDLTPTVRRSEGKKGKTYRAGKLSPNVPRDTQKRIIAMDAGSNCLPGDSLIATDLGILQIDELALVNQGEHQKLNRLVAGHTNPTRTSLWHYSGKNTGIRVKTDAGYVIAPTLEHDVQVLRNGELHWVKTKNLCIGDELCINPRSPLRQSKMILNLQNTKPITYTHNTRGHNGIYYNRGKFEAKINQAGYKKHLGSFDTIQEAVDARNKIIMESELTHRKIKPKKPEYMTTNLAYTIGALISEGWFNKYHTGMTNSNLKMLKKATKGLQVFNFKSKISLRAKANTPYEINGKKGNSNFDIYGFTVSSATLSEWWQQLGLKISRGKGVSSYTKIVPWSILQADAESQRAFMAAYIEGDGSIRKDRQEIVVWSSSTKLLRQMQILMLTHGIVTIRRKKSIRTASVSDACRLYDLIAKHLTFKQCSIYSKSTGRPIKTEGVDGKNIKRLFQLRKIKADKNGTVFENDDGKHVIVKEFSSTRFGSRLLYSSYKNGSYDNLLLALAQISKKAHRNLVMLLNAEYRYSSIVSLKNITSKRKVYDLTMVKKAVPAFTTNGLVVHNCNSFSITGGYYDTEQDKPVIDIMLELMPTMQYPINFNYIYEDVISPIIEQANGQLLLADRWQNLKIMHDAEKEHGCEIETYSAKYSDFATFKEELIIGNFIIPRPELSPGEVEAVGDKAYPQGFVGKPISHFIYQLIGVQDHGKSVEKGDGVTDDILRASVLLHAYLIDMDYRDMCSGNTGHVNKRSGMPGFVGLRSQGSASANPNGNYGAFGSVGSLGRMR